MANEAVIRQLMPDEAIKELEAADGHLICRRYYPLDEIWQDLVEMGLVRTAGTLLRGGEEVGHIFRTTDKGKLVLAAGNTENKE